MPAPVKFGAVGIAIGATPYMSFIAEKTAEHLLEISAVRLSPSHPFTWSSGWQSPIYCDNRLVLSYPNVRDFIKSSLLSLIHEHFGHLEALAGVATAGIPMGAILADELEIPFLYVRSSAKSHGLANMIEGRIVPGQKVVVMEDLVSTGGSSIKAANALREAGLDVVGMVAVFTYGLPDAEKAFTEAGIPLYTLSDYNTLLKVATEKGVIQETDHYKLSQWRENPEGWGK